MSTGQRSGRRSATSAAATSSRPTSACGSRRAFTGDPLDAFCRAVTRLDPPYAAFMRTPGGAVASLSPELFLRRTGTSVRSRPIKGTRSRPAGEQARATAACRARALRQGPRGERDDRRPDAQRPQPGLRARQRAGAGAAARRGPSRRVASGLGGPRHAAGRDGGRGS